MKKLDMQRRLAANILGVGKKSVVFNPERLEDISKAITRADIKDLIKEKVIQKRIIKKQKRKRKKRKRNIGSIKKRIKRKKERYIAKIRKIRRYLTELKIKKIISREEYQKLRKLAKAGLFKTRRHLKEYLITLGKKISEEK
ncbi:MAG: 50S ribosomal protein L19e [Candidatus Pacearchaeota archaeon]